MIYYRTRGMINIDSFFCVVKIIHEDMGLFDTNVILANECGEI